MVGLLYESSFHVQGIPAALWSDVINAFATFHKFLLCFFTVFAIFIRHHHALAITCLFSVVSATVRIYRVATTPHFLVFYWVQVVASRHQVVTMIIEAITERFLLGLAGFCCLSDR